MDRCATWWQEFSKITCVATLWQNYIRMSRLKESDKNTVWLQMCNKVTGIYENDNPVTWWNAYNEVEWTLCNMILKLNSLHIEKKTKQNKTQPNSYLFLRLCKTKSGLSFSMNQNGPDKVEFTEMRCKPPSNSFY